MIKRGYNGLPKRTFFIVGFSFVFMGVLFLLNSAQGITGFAVFEEAEISSGLLVSVWFVVAGLLVLGMAERKRKVD